MDSSENHQPKKLPMTLEKTTLETHWKFRCFRIFWDLRYSRGLVRFLTYLNNRLGDVLG